MNGISIEWWFFGSSLVGTLAVGTSLGVALGWRLRESIERRIRPEDAAVDSDAAKTTVYNVAHLVRRTKNEG